MILYDIMPAFAEKEIEQLVRKYNEARYMKAYNSFFVVSSKIDLERTENLQ